MADPTRVRAAYVILVVFVLIFLFSLLHLNCSNDYGSALWMSVNCQTLLGIGSSDDQSPVCAMQALTTLVLLVFVAYDGARGRNEVKGI